MLIVISPAKTLDFDNPARASNPTQPQFLQQSQQLIEQLRFLAPVELSELMSISTKLGDLNALRYDQWHTPFTTDNAKPAIEAFRGDVYTGIEADSLNQRDFNYAQKHLRILSGLYGVLRPLDLIQAYRLEMGTRFKNTKGKNLYEFWGDCLTEHVNSDAQGSKAVINLASNEYFKAVKPKLLDAEVITPHFKDFKNGEYKIISFFAKKARGMMTRFAIDERIKNPQLLKQFGYGGYQFKAELSNDTNWTFLRDEVA